jgi:hypothetical protein
MQFRDAEVVWLGALPMNKIPFGRHVSVAGQTAHLVAEGSRGRVKHVLDAGRLTFGCGTSGIDCTIMDISGSKARVRVRIEPTSVPKRMALIHLRARVAYEATVVWKDDDFLGLELTCEYDLNNPSTPELQAMSLQCLGH